MGFMTELFTEIDYLNHIRYQIESGTPNQAGWVEIPLEIPQTLNPKQFVKTAEKFFTAEGYTILKEFPNEPHKGSWYFKAPLKPL